MNTNSEKNNIDNRKHEVRRALVSLKKLNEVIGRLPSPKEYDGRSTIIKVGLVDIKFEKIVFVDSEGNSEYRWSYSSRIVI